MPRVLWHHWYAATVRCAGHTFVNPRNRFLFLRVWLLVDAVCSCNPSFNSFVSVFKQGELCRSDLFGRTRLTIASLPADQAQSTTPSPASYIAPDSSSQFRNRDVTLLSGCTMIQICAWRSWETCIYRAGFGEKLTCGVVGPPLLLKTAHSIFFIAT